MEAELEEANAIATASNHKYEDVNRKLKVVEGDLERIVERAEEFENKERGSIYSKLIIHESCITWYIILWNSVIQSLYSLGYF